MQLYNGALTDFHLSFISCCHALYSVLRIWVIYLFWQILHLAARSIWPGEPRRCLLTCVRVCLLYTLGCTDGMNLLWPCLIWHCHHVASSRLLQSVTRTPNMEFHNL